MCYFLLIAMYYNFYHCYIKAFDIGIYHCLQWDPKYISKNTNFSKNLHYTYFIAEQIVKCDFTDIVIPFITLMELIKDGALIFKVNILVLKF